MRETQTEVLVVGAGPVGLWCALLLAERGLEVTLIDREARTTARSYACAIHPSTLQLLDRLGLAQSVIERGNRIDTIAFYDGANRQAEIHMAKSGGEFPFLVILPQSSLEDLLEQRLRAAGVRVHWNHRFEGLTEDEETVSATIEELEGTSTGYIVPHWETVVKNRATMRTQFLIGADGHNSMVRPRADSNTRKWAKPNPSPLSSSKRAKKPSMSFGSCSMGRRPMCCGLWPKTVIAGHFNYCDPNSPEISQKRREDPSA